MIVVKSIQHMASIASDYQDVMTGFVPTMGALHPGHLSLIRKCHEDNIKTVVSIYVNPSQFNDPADFENYPRETERDIQLLSEENVDYLFLPTTNDIYPELDSSIYDLDNLQNFLEGEYRPGHFNGVASVVKRLFEIVRPNRAYFGLKDFQQFKVIKSLNKNYQLGVDIIGCETMRENDGLAMSSRNKRLSKKERELAVNLSKALKIVAENGKEETPDRLEQMGKEFLAQYKGINLEYFKVLNSENLLDDVKNRNHTGERIALLAAKIGDVRLIDNMKVR